jgi:hypothetical protein
MIFSDLALPAEAGFSDLASHAEAGFAKAGSRFTPRIKCGAGFFGIML